MTSSDWATVADAAELLGVRRTSVYRLMKRAAEQNETIRTMQVNRSTMVHLPSLRAFEAKSKPGRPRKST